MRYQVIRAIPFEQNCSMHRCAETMKAFFVDPGGDPGSIGCTDFPRGHHQHLINSIRSKLWPLGNDVAFIPGHGPMSTFVQERLSNHYVGDHGR